MALIRRSGARFSANIWPGFVDAMTAILLVLMFVLSIFMIVQSILRDTITGQNSELLILNSKLDDIRNELGLEKSKLAQLDYKYETKLGELKKIQRLLVSETNKFEELELEFFKKTEKLSVANSDLSRLNFKLFSLADQLGSKQDKYASLEKKYEEKALELDAANSNTEESLALLSALRSEFSLAKSEIVDFKSQIASLLSIRANLSEELEMNNAQIQNQLSQIELAELALANAREEIDDSNENARLAAARSEALEALVEDLRVRNMTVDSNYRNMDEKFSNQSIKLMKLEDEYSVKEQELDEASRNRMLDQIALKNLTQKLNNEKEEIGILTLALDAERKKALETLRILASAQAVKDKLNKKNQYLEGEIGSKKELLEAKQIALKEARSQLLTEKEKTTSSILEINRLTLFSENLTQKLSDLEAILKESEIKDKNRNVEIKLLGSKLNAALARVASEQRKRAELEAKEVERLLSEAKDLKSYRSEFFGRLRKILGEKEGIQIVGDRFVFSSEILFEPGSAVLGKDGKRQLNKVAMVIRDVSKEIPQQINWILRVDGHTDITPLAVSSEFEDNWELSQARALSVVRYFIRNERIASNRLAATGFGQFQPIDKGSSQLALARNRRIELKLTER